MSKDSTQLAQDRTDWAEARTDWAEDRTLMASERTYAAWIRTGLTCIVISLGLQAVFGDVEPAGLAKAVATLFLLAAIVIFWTARGRAEVTLKSLTRRACATQPIGNHTALALFLTASTVATGVVLWLL